MAICSSAGFWEVLKQLGAPENCVKFVLVAENDQPVKVRATFYPDLNVEEIKIVTKRYKLIEDKDA